MSTTVVLRRGTSTTYLAAKFADLSMASTYDLLMAFVVHYSLFGVHTGINLLPVDTVPDTDVDVASQVPHAYPETTKAFW
jgi:hypothetical protein